MNNNLEYYLNLNYSIEIKEIPESEGGGFIARLPQFGELGIVGDGETILEALEELEEYKKLVFEEYLTNGKTLPEPEDDSLEKYSGRFVVRVPKYLHKELSGSAKKNEVSLNSYITTLLSSSHSIERTQAIFEDLSLKFDQVHATVKEMAYGNINCSVGKKNPLIDGYDQNDYRRAA